MSWNLAQSTEVSEVDYLAAEKDADVKHEYLNGMVYPLHWDPVSNMAGASEANVNITGNAYMSLRQHLRSSPCSAYMSDMRLKIDAGDKAWFYPDVMVCCDPDDSQQKTVKYTPILIVEVLSNSTRDYDKGGKFDAYRQLTSLREYVLVDPKQYLVEVFRLNAEQRWELFMFRGKECSVEFTSIDFVCSLSDLYEDVDVF